MKYTLTSILFVLGVVTAVIGQKPPVAVYHVGDTLYRAEDRLPSNPRLIHSNLQDYWDFTGLMAPYVHEIHIRALSSAPVKDKEVVHCRLSNADGFDYKIVIEDENMWISGIQVKHDQNVIEGEYSQYLPLRVNTSVVSSEGTYSGKIVFNLTTDMVAALKDAELALADSIRLIVDWNYRFSNDQTGQLQMESGLYDVVRQELMKTVNVQTEIKHGGTWKVTPKPLSVVLPMELHSGTIFSFWSDEYPDALAVVETDELENAISVSFRARKQLGRRVIQSAPSQPDIFVHPNPSFGIVRFDLVNLPLGSYQLEIYNILGVRLRSFSLDVDGSMSYPLNLSDLKKGTYIYRLVDSYQKTLRSKRIVIITP